MKAARRVWFSFPRGPTSPREWASVSDSYAHLLKDKDFRLLVGAVGLSSFGDVLAAVALTIRIHDLTGSGLAVAALLFADLVAHVVLSPWAGMLVDRLETRRVLMLVSACQAVVALGLVFAHSVPLIVGLLFLLGAGASAGNPAIMALLPRVVGRGRITPANAALDMSRHAGGMAAPVTAGVMAGALGTGSALLVDAASFAALAMAAAALGVRRPPQDTSDDTDAGRLSFRHAREGFSFLWDEPVLRLAAVVLTTTVVFAVMDNVALVFFAKDSLRAGDGGYGALLSAWTAGMVAGILFIARRLSTRRLALSLLLADAATGVTVLIAAMWPHFGLALALFVLGGAGNGVVNVTARSLIHHRTPDRLHGRVFAANAALLSSGQIAAVMFGGLLVGAIGGRATLLLAGTGTIVVAVLGLIAYVRVPATATEFSDSHSAERDRGHAKRD